MPRCAEIQEDRHSVLNVWFSVACVWAGRMYFSGDLQWQPSSYDSGNTKPGTLQPYGKGGRCYVRLTQGVLEMESSHTLSTDFGKWILDRLLFRLCHVSLNVFTFSGNCISGVYGRYILL